jgi:hypothetical protein
MRRLQLSRSSVIIFGSFEKGGRALFFWPSLLGRDLSVVFVEIESDIGPRLVPMRSRLPCKFAGGTRRTRATPCQASAAKWRFLDS